MGSVRSTSTVEVLLVDMAEVRKSRNGERRRGLPREAKGLCVAHKGKGGVDTEGEVPMFI